jgi:hypothetical protein
MAIRAAANLITPAAHLSRRRLVIYAVTAGFLGIALLLVVLAAGVAASLEPESGALTGGATVVTDATASGGKAVRFSAAATPTPTPTPTSTPTPTATPTGTKPSAANTGVPAGTTLTAFNGFYTVSTNGAVVDALNIKGSLTINANNVTIKRTHVQCIGVNDECVQVVAGHTGTIIQDSDIGGGANYTTNTGSPIGILTDYGAGINNAANTTLLRVNVHHTIDGLRLDGNTTIQDSYIHDLDHSDPTAHGDGSQTTGGRYLSFLHNTIEAGLNSSIYLNWDEPSYPSIGYVTFDRNYFEGTNSGTSYPLYVNDGTVVGTITATNNQWNRLGNPYAPALDYLHAISTWTNNTYEDNGATIAKP